MIEAETTRVSERSYPTLEEAQSRAGAEAVNTGGFTVPVVVFRQGTRTFMSGALPMVWVKARLEANPAPKGASIAGARAATNRPEIPEHSKQIAKYLRENIGKKYILPPLTLNVQHATSLYTLDTASGLRTGYLVIPPTARLGITDGQHRRSAIIETLETLNEEEQERFGGDAVAVMITCETDRDQVHQDFADCSRTKPLPASMVALYDRRNPVNRMVADLEERCILFRGRIDSTSKTLSKKSTYLFLGNQLRQLVKELLAGSYALTDQDLERRVRQLVETDQQYADAVTKFCDYINFLTARIEVWEEISNLSPTGLEARQVPVRRAEGWVSLTATGLNLIGRVGYSLFSQPGIDWGAYAKRLAELDWRREAAIWQANIIQSGRVMNQQAPLKRAFEVVATTISLPRL